MKQKVYLSIGSNIGDREINILKSIVYLEKREDVEISKISSFYETEPVGYEEQDIFVNCAVEIRTSLKPFKLLEVLKNIETEIGREMLFRWGPRIIDLDIVFKIMDTSIKHTLIVFNNLSKIENVIIKRDPKEELVDFILNINGEFKTKKITDKSRELNIPLTSTKRIINKLLEDNKIKKLNFGIYKLFK